MRVEIIEHRLVAILTEQMDGFVNSFIKKIVGTHLKRKQLLYLKFSFTYITQSHLAHLRQLVVKGLALVKILIDDFLGDFFSVVEQFQAQHERKIFGGIFLEQIPTTFIRP